MQVPEQGEYYILIEKHKNDAEYISNRMINSKTLGDLINAAGKSQSNFMKLYTTPPNLSGDQLRDALGQKQGEHYYCLKISVNKTAAENLIGSRGQLIVSPNSNALNLPITVQAQVFTQAVGNQMVPVQTEVTDIERINTKRAEIDARDRRLQQEGTAKGAIRAAASMVKHITGEKNRSKENEPPGNTKGSTPS